MAFACLFKYLIEMYIEESEKKGIKNINERLLLSRRFMPLILQMWLHVVMITGKLSEVMKEKLENDLKGKDIADFEKFLSVFSYSDMKGAKFIKFIKKYLKIIKREYIFDMTLFKLVSYYFLRSKNRRTDQLYENLIGDLILKARGLPKRNKGKIIAEYRGKRLRRTSIEDGKKKEGD